MKTRIEHDLLGEKEVPADAYYGIQTLRGIENFQNISGITIGDYPNYVKALAMGCCKGKPGIGNPSGRYCQCNYPGL